jgi:hypothetical protein
LDDENSYYEDLTEDQVRCLGADFLVENGDRLIGFAHDSRKDSISRLDPGKETGHTESELLPFDQIRNHRYTLLLYIQIMSVPAHDIWKSPGTAQFIQPWLELFKGSKRKSFPRDRIELAPTLRTPRNLQLCQQTSCFISLYTVYKTVNISRRRPHFSTKSGKPCSTVSPRRTVLHVSFRHSKFYI